MDLKRPFRRLWRAALMTPLRPYVPGFGDLDRVISGYLDSKSGTERARHLTWAFTRKESPYTRAVVRAGGLMRAAIIVTGLQPDEKLPGTRGVWFATQEHPDPTLGDAIRGLASLLSLLQINHPGLWVDAGSPTPKTADFDPADYDPSLIFKTEEP